MGKPKIEYDHGVTPNGSEDHAPITNKEHQEYAQEFRQLIEDFVNRHPRSGSVAGMLTDAGICTSIAGFASPNQLVESVLRNLATLLQAIEEQRDPETAEESFIETLQTLDLDEDYQPLFTLLRKGLGVRGMANRKQFDSATLIDLLNAAKRGGQS